MKVILAKKQMPHALLFNDPKLRDENSMFPPMFSQKLQRIKKTASSYNTHGLLLAKREHTGAPAVRESGNAGFGFPAPPQSKA